LIDKNKIKLIYLTQKMSEIINVFMCEEFVKRREKFALPGYMPGVPTRLNRFTTETGTLDSIVLGGKVRDTVRVQGGLPA
jgi:hypothetical protein